MGLNLPHFPLMLQRYGSSSPSLPLFLSLLKSIPLCCCYHNWMIILFLEIKLLPLCDRIRSQISETLSSLKMQASQDIPRNPLPHKSLNRHATLPCSLLASLTHIDTVRKTRLHKALVNCEMLNLSELFLEYVSSFHTIYGLCIPNIIMQ